MILQTAEQTFRQALATGSIEPIQNQCEQVQEGAFCFALRTMESLAKKPRSVQSAGQPPRSPFLPPEPELLVADAGPAHVYVLNKFPVLPQHLLVVTREFIEQETLLTEADFTAWLPLMQEAPGLAFYNSGRLAGASQRHKHMQWIAGADWPLSPARQALPFAHWWRPLPSLTPARVYALYREGLDQLGWQSGQPYNLLFTRDWLMLIPRKQADWHGLSVNSLGFVGSLLVRHAEQGAEIKTKGLMNALCAVAGWPTVD